MYNKKDNSKKKKEKWQKYQNTAISRKNLIEINEMQR